MFDTDLAAVGEAGGLAGSVLLESLAALVEPAGPAEPAAGPVGLPAPPYGNPPLPWTATACSPITRKQMEVG